MRYPLAFSLGVVSGFICGCAPSPAVLNALLGCGCGVVAVQRLRVVGLFMLGFVWLLLNAHWHRADQLSADHYGRQVTLDGYVASIPKAGHQSVRFLFRADQPGSERYPRRIMVSWYRDYPPLAAGQRWRLQLKLMPPRGRVNFHGFDYERWLFGNRVGGLASVRSGQRLADRQTWPSRPVLVMRQQVARFIADQAGDTETAALAGALAVGDRSGLGTDHWRLLAATGTSHLIAISGLHVGMVALFGFFVGRLLYFLIPLQRRYWSSIRAGAFCAVVIAVAYSLLAGWVLPTRRALMMLVILMTALMARRTVRPYTALVWALGLVLLLDPLAPLLAGFWLSFAAVFLLIFGLSGRLSDGGSIRGFATAQWLVVIGLLPLTVVWFQRVSWVALLANSVAIPVISLLVLPLLLVMLIVLPMAPGIASYVLGFTAYPIKALLALLGWLAQLPAVTTPVPVPAPGLMLVAMAGVLWLLMPRGWPARWLGMVLLLPLFWPPQQGLSKGQWRLHLLDVGQGLSVLIETREHLLVYDSGPGDGDSVNMLASTVIPAVLHTGRSDPDRIIISHADLDHAGGLAGLAQKFPQSDWRVSLPEMKPRLISCLAGETWRWDGITFQILHPTAGLPYIGNNSSCVLYIRSDQGSILLAGDITEVIEQRLLRQYPDLRADALLVPHHGSKTSSGATFVQALNPGLALVSAGYLNRFGMPARSVSDRYLQQGSVLVNTAQCGAVRVLTGPGRVLAWQSARLVRRGFWRQSAGLECLTGKLPDRDRTEGFGYYSKPVPYD